MNIHRLGTTEIYVLVSIASFLFITVIASLIVALVMHFRDTSQESAETYWQNVLVFWSVYGQMLLSAFVIISITILLISGVISAEAGLPILAGVGGFAIGKGPSGSKNQKGGDESANPKSERSKPDDKKKHNTENNSDSFR